MANNGTIAMHAVLRVANGHANAKGDTSYKLAFAYPLGYIGEVVDFLGEKIDIYWNNVLIAQDALLTDTKQKFIKDSDPDCLMYFEAAQADGKRTNAIASLNEAGDLRLFAKQLALDLKD